MKNILIDASINEEKLKCLKSIKGVNAEVIEYREEARYIPAEILKDKHILFCSYPPKNFEDMKSLEFIQLTSSGYSQLFNLGLEEKGIKACNARGNSDAPIAEWNIAMMINLARDLRGLIRNQEAGVWDQSVRFQTEIRGLTVGIWGYGSIGRETARLAKALGLKVYALDRFIYDSSNGPLLYVLDGAGDRDAKIPDKCFTLEQKEEFLKDLDFLVLAIPLTNETKGIIGEKELKALKPKAFIINAARGPLIQEEALLKVLREGSIAGAALDTHNYYPMPADHPLWRFPNVIITPHISGAGLTLQSIERIWDIFVQNVERYSKGLPLLNQLTSFQLSGK